MKRTWVALAVIGAFASAAQAQTSVTLYGIVDIGYHWTELPTLVGTGTAARIQQESKSAIDPGGQSGNRWGLRGAEDLGGGMSAIFTLESGFNIDTGTLGQGTASATGGRLFGRQAYVGMRSGLGTVVAGRLATFSSGTGDFDMFGRVDPMGTSYGIASAGNSFYSLNATRIDNAILYQSPIFAGFRGGIGYSTRTDGTETAPSSTNNDAFFSALSWEAGPFWIAATYDVFTGVGNQDDQKHLQIGGTFDLGPFRLHAGFADHANVRAVPTAPTGGSGAFIVLPAGIPSYDAQSYLAGATWTIGAFKIFGSWQMQDADSVSVPTISGVPPVNFDPDFNIYSIGATYNISRRTNFYAAYGTRDADGTLNGTSFDGNEFWLGIRHLF